MEMADRIVRKLRRAFHEPGQAHYLTYSCVNRWPLLAKERTCRWVVDAIEEARRRHEFDLHAFVIMPEHVHLLIRPRHPECNLDRILYDLKRPVSWKAKNWLIQHGNDDWIGRLSFRHGSRKVFRFWLAGGGFDRGVFRDLALSQVVQYIHGNPVRRGLVAKPEDWIWSSARFWGGMDGSPLKMDPIPV